MADMREGQAGSPPASDGKGKHGRKRAGPRQPRKISPTYLERAALYYLERYATSAENLRRVLRRKVMRSARYHEGVHETDAAAAEEWISALVERYIRSGLLNDRTYAEARARSLHGRGKGLRAIRGTLAQKGVAEDVIEQAIATLAEEEAVETPAALDLRAALKLARKRRLGPFGTHPDTRDENRERDMARLARAGFSYDIARRVIGAPTPQDAEALAED